MSYQTEEIIKTSWEAVKDHIRGEYKLTDISYTTWIKNLSIAEIRDNTVYILIPDKQEHAQSYISDKFSDYFKVTVSEMVGEDYAIEFVTEKSQEEPIFSEEPEEEPLPVSGGLSNLSPKYVFDSFVVGSTNKFAYSACVAVAESPGRAYNPLFLYGGAGLGKTHLMHSIGHYILSQNPSLKVLYVTSEHFTNEVIESIRSGSATSMARFRDKYRTADVLLVDDIQFIIGKESTQEEFFHTFNELHDSGRQVVLSSDRPPKEMETLDERFRSRFVGGLLADIQAPDYETRMAILRKNAELINHTFVSDEALNFISNNIRSNIRELEGALRKLLIYASLNNLDSAFLTEEDAKNAIKDMIYPEGSEVVTPSLIAKTVCDHYGVTLANVASRKKNAELVLPRQIIMYLCREYTDSTYTNIAHLLHKNDHTTIIYGWNKVKEEIVKNEELRNNVDILLKKLNLAP